MSSKLSPRQKQKLFRYAQYALLAVIALAAILLADWKTLSQQVFNLDVAAAQFPDVITVALKNTLLYTTLGFIVGLSGGLLLALMRISSIAPYRWIATLYVELFRGIPALLVFFAFGYGIPLAFKIRFVDNLIPVTLSLGMVSAAYISEGSACGGAGDSEGPDGGGTLPGYVPHSRDDFDHYSPGVPRGSAPADQRGYLADQGLLPRVPAGRDGFSVRAGEVRS